MAGALALLNAGYSALEADVANAESSQAVDDIAAFTTGLCSAANAAQCKIKSAPPETFGAKAKALGSRAWWDVKAPVQNGLYLIGIRR